MIIFGILLIIPFVLAINVNVEKESNDEVMIVDVNEPAIVDLKVTNLDEDDRFLFYTFFGAGIEPVERISINKEQTKEVQLKIYPRQDSVLRGFSTFEYFIQAKDKSQVAEKISVRVIDLKDAFNIGAQEIDPESNKIQIYVENNANINFDRLNVNLDSAFFKVNQEISLTPYEKKIFEITLNKEDYSRLFAGFYTLDTKITYKETVADISTQINFVEKNLLETSKEDYGFIVSTKIIEKRNKGNVVASSTTTIKKNIISRLFTTFNPAPSDVQRQGFNVYYTWSSEVEPGETLKIKVRTNWILPLIILILIVAILIIVKKYSEQDLVLRKRISFINAKGGEFALKVTIYVKARKYLEKVNIIDRLPPLVRIYEKFLNEKPSKVDEARKKLEWGFGKLEEGERRVLSYIVYSKVGVLGKFALPATTGIYEREGKIKEVSSNKAYFVADQITKRPEDK